VHVHRMPLLTRTAVQSMVSCVLAAFIKHMPGELSPGAIPHLTEHGAVRWIHGSQGNACRPLG